jgi:molecular chaperone IbpA
MNTLPKIDTLALHKAFVGFDRVLDGFESRFANQMSSNYPPHNIIKLDDYNYTIEMAVAGFNKSEISIEVQRETLTIKGTKSTTDESTVQYLHRGLSSRDFIRTFTLADHIQVRTATIDNGILSVSLELIIPEEMKPRTIEIQDLSLLTDK